MSLILPAWVEHHSDTDEKKKRQTIFSLHVHPDGSRLATGGLDQKIRVWATEPILNEKVEEMEGTNKLLCTMSRHTGEWRARATARGGEVLEVECTTAQVTVLPFADTLLNATPAPSRLCTGRAMVTIGEISRLWLRRYHLPHLGP